MEPNQAKPLSNPGYPHRFGAHHQTEKGDGLSNECRVGTSSNRPSVWLPRSVVLRRHLIKLGGVRLPKVGEQPLARAIELIPAAGLMQRRYGDGFTAIETDQGCVHQPLHLHQLRQAVGIDAGTSLDIASRGGRENRLHIDPFRRKLQAHPLGQEQHEGLGRTIDGCAKLGCEPNH